jgi:ankyrin repeat protein
MLAALIEHKEVIDYLVQKGADINKRVENGETAFSYAAGEANKILCQCFTKLRARPNNRLDDGSTVLIQALQSDNIAFLRWLIPACEYNIQDRDTSGQTLLMYAVNKSLATTQFVVKDLKMDVNACDASGVTPLILIARTLELDKIRFLVENGSRVNVQNNEGLTPIIYIAQAARVNDSGPPNDAAWSIEGG